MIAESMAILFLVYDRFHLNYRNASYKNTRSFISFFLEEELPRRLRFDVIHHLKIYLASSEMKQLNTLKDEYKRTTYMVSAVSLLNVICTAAFIRGFWNYKWYSKAFIATFVFGTSHYCGMYKI